MGVGGGEIDRGVGESLVQQPKVRRLLHDQRLCLPVLPDQRQRQGRPEPAAAANLKIGG